MGRVFHEKGSVKLQYACLRYAKYLGFRAALVARADGGQHGRRVDSSSLRHVVDENRRDDDDGLLALKQAKEEEEQCCC